MGNFKFEIEAVGGHGDDRTAKRGEKLNLDPRGVDACGEVLINALKSKGCSVVSAKLIHWPDTTPLVDNLLTGERDHGEFGESWQGEEMLKYFAFAHLPEGPMRETSRMFCHLAFMVVRTVPRSPERTVALRKLLEGKDAAVRAAMASKP